MRPRNALAKRSPLRASSRTIFRPRGRCSTSEMSLRYGRKSSAERSPTAYVRAARILGFVDARLAALGSGRFTVQEQEYDRVLAVLRDAMGAELVANLMADGAAMTEDQAVEEALAV